MIVSDAELRRTIETKLNESLSIIPARHVPYCFDSLSTWDKLFDHFKSLVHSSIPLDGESMQKTSHLVIDSFINWFRSLPFSSHLTKNLNEQILNQRWSKFLFFAISHFLTQTVAPIPSLSYDEYLRRLFDYQHSDLLSPLVEQLVVRLFSFLSELARQRLTQTEYTLLNILIVIRYGRQRA